jgi:hypothetical protein
MGGKDINVRACLSRFNFSGAKALRLGLDEPKRARYRKLMEE